MSIINKLINNPLFISIQRSIQNYKIEKKLDNVVIWNMSLINNSNLWKCVTIKNETNITNSNIWDYTFISHACNISFTNIWKFCSIWQNLKSGLWKHPTDMVSTHGVFFSIWKQHRLTFVDKDYFNERSQNNIWNDVWIWTNVTLIDWVSVWNWAIIWAGSVVTKDVPPYAIVWWVPARVIRYRFKDEIIEKLLKIEWWNKDSEWIKNNALYFRDVEKFIDKFNV
jgi:acetyltransferase-like isoleucine patch superfamily enzyme